jgi:hypothetical protein
VTDTKDINPVYVDGEPRCSREDCAAFHRSGWEQYEPSTCEITGYNRMYDCIPALRRDRDEAIENWRGLRAMVEAAADAAFKLTPKDDSDRVERVATVLLDNFGDLGDFNWEKLDEEIREEWRGQARDVLSTADMEE